MTKIVLSPYSAACFDYIGEDHVRRKVTFVLSPIRISWENNAMVIHWACSKANSCANQACRYAKASKPPYEIEESTI